MTGILSRAEPADPAVAVWTPWGYQQAPRQDVADRQAEVQIASSDGNDSRGRMLQAPQRY